MGRIVLFLVVVLFSAHPLSLLASVHNQSSLLRAQQLSVHALDSALPDQPLEEWFRAVLGPGAEVVWEVKDSKTSEGRLHLVGVAESYMKKVKVDIALRFPLSEQGASGHPTLTWIRLYTDVHVGEWIVLNTLSEIRAELDAENDRERWNAGAWDAAVKSVREENGLPDLNRTTRHWYTR